MLSVDPSTLLLINGLKQFAIQPNQYDCDYYQNLVYMGLEQNFLDLKSQETLSISNAIQILEALNMKKSKIRLVFPKKK